MTLSEKIIYYRRKAGLSQEQLAEKLGVSRQAVSKWETGEASPEVNKLRTLAEALGVTADELLSPEEPPQSRQQEPAHSSATQEGGYPSWLNDLPGAVGKLVKRFGYLAGVYTMVVGLVFVLIGGVTILAARSMTRAFDQYAADPFGTGVSGTVQWYDEKGNPIDAPKGWEQMLPEQDPSLSQVQGSRTGISSFTSPVEAFGTVILGLGLLIFAFGVWLTVRLRRLRQENQ